MKSLIKKGTFLLATTSLMLGVATSAQAATSTQSTTEPESIASEGVILPGDTIPTRDIEGEWVLEEEVGITPFISPVNCGSRKDWYRTITSSNVAFCYANSGTMDVLTKNVKKLCPGANRGRVMYMHNALRYWTTWRGKVTNYNTCYSFDAPQEIVKVEIL